jgi:predicted metalloprotease with PDZ domain
LRLPTDWQYATALDIGDASTFAPVRLDTLVDSPVLAGLHLRNITLQSPGNPPHSIAIAADSAPALAMSAAAIANTGELITQAGKLFGRFHFPSYRFLVAASDYTAGGGGIEHGASSDDRVPESFYRNAAIERSRFNLYSHEYVHSWDGKFRIPLGHVASDFQTPLRSDLLWVYEGLTSYLGNVLGARSGACTPEYFREHLAALVAGANARTGRRWRPLQDTLDATSATMEAGFSVPTGWDSRHRTLDFYDEGPLIWLEVDTLLRRESHGTQSLDDFAKDFFGVDGQFPEVRSYVANDVYRSLDRLVQHNWRAFFEERLTSLAETAPTRGLIDSGWRLVFNEVPNQHMSDVAARLGGIDERFTLGLVITPDGAVVDVIEGSPAARAALFPGQRIRSIDGRSFNPNLLRDAVGARKPIHVVTAFAGFEQAHELQYGGGLQFPHLERVAQTPDLLTAIVSPR